mgnify:CR=1 FL=1
MSALSEKMKAKREQLDEQRKARIEEGKKEFKELFTEFFEAYPEVTALRWRQYTPYFNDGDSCEFSIGELFATAHPIKADGDTESEDGDYDDGYDLPKYNTPLRDDMRAVALVMDDDVCLALFGDHVKVTIPRGSDAIVEDYSHD